MLMLEINDKGVTAPNLDEIISEKSEGYRLIYGRDIGIDASDPDGQRIGIESQAVKDAYDTLLYAIQMKDPQYAKESGRKLSQSFQVLNATKENTRFCLMLNSLLIDL